MEATELFSAVVGYEEVFMTLGFIGFGLIGGSIAKGLKKKDPTLRIMAFSLNPSELEAAQEDGIVNVILEQAASPKIAECDMVFLCAPAEENIRYLSAVSNVMNETAILTDVSSTKEEICKAAAEMNLQDRFIGGHPMAGSEQSGYAASSDYLFSNAYYILTPLTDNQRLIDGLKQIAEQLQAIPVIVDAKKHDAAIAAVSHLPHIVASSLVNLVKGEDDEQQTMKMLAAGGFRDITRIASSSPVMWQQICQTNAAAITNVLDHYIQSLSEISECLKQQEKNAVPDQKILSLFEDARAYRNSINAKNKGAITPDYSFSVDIADEVGAISTISVILASKGISIKNIGINNARDHGEGALRIAFYEEDAKELAKQVLKRYQYDIR